MGSGLGSPSAVVGKGGKPQQGPLAYVWWHMGPARPLVALLTGGDSCQLALERPLLSPLAQATGLSGDSGSVGAQALGHEHSLLSPSVFLALPSPKADGTSWAGGIWAAKGLTPERVQLQDKLGAQARVWVGAWFQGPRWTPSADETWGDCCPLG
ncbi:Hypothetical predicted protein [Marmota monax]|uniref:Uncharacterized protein n=1 Tax=Marmota monax TaxID=9995 RepID=A0A5E4D0T3_MARMO|nr:hypothetical protein GHT09_010086 [Marmota monax]VTJ87717.1 Hypothetical predicted protein [Marmota monax]